nr:hypothetical protein [Aquabacter cavernae]
MLGARGADARLQRVAHIERALCPHEAHAHSEAADVLELVEASLDAVTVFVAGDVMRDGDLAAAVRRDYRLGAHAGDQRAQGIAAIGFIGEHGFGGHRVEQGWRGGSAKRIGEHVNLGGQPTSGTPQRLIRGPPFPVAACWWARTMVLSSIRYLLSRSAPSEANTRSHTPEWHQWLNRLCTVFQCP